MKTIKKIFKKIQALSSIIKLIVIVYIAWLIEPQNYWVRTSHIKNSTLCSVYCIIAISYWSARWVVNRHKEIKHLIKRQIKYTKGFVTQAIEQTSNIVKHFKKEKIITSLFNKKNYIEYRTFKDIPAFVLIGPRKSGKKSIVLQSELQFIEAEHIGHRAIQCVNQFPDYDWIYSSNALFITIPQPDNNEPDTTLKKLCKHLIKRKIYQPVNAVLLTYNIYQLSQQSDEARRNELASICSQLKQLHATLKSTLPVFFVLTHFDKLTGFSDFFQHYDRESLAQAWGFSLDTSEQNNINPILNKISSMMDTFIAQLEDMMLFVLSEEQDPIKRCSIFKFTQHFKQLKKTLLTSISELFGNIRYTNAIDLKGIYFMASHEATESSPFINYEDSSSQKLAIKRNHKKNCRLNRYFISDFFHNILIPAGMNLGLTKKYKIFKNIKRRFLYISIPIGLAIFIIIINNSYQSILSNLEVMQSKIALFNTRIEGWPKKSTTYKTLVEILKPINDIYEMSLSFPAMMRTLPASKQINQNSYSALQRATHQLLQPKIGLQFETQLNLLTKKNANEYQYQLLKGYLAFSDHKEKDSHAILSAFSLYSKKNTNITSSDKDAILHFIEFSIQQPITILPMNNKLIDKIRKKLQLNSLIDRAYNLLQYKSLSSNLAPLDLNNIINFNNDSLFYYHSSVLLSIPALYQKQGLKKIVTPTLTSIADEVLKDNTLLGITNAHFESTSGLTEDIKNKYKKNYYKTWDNTLNNLDIKKDHSIRNITRQLDKLSSNTSGISILLSIINKNIIKIDSKKPRSDQQSEPSINLIAHYFSNTDSDINYKTTILQLNTINSILKSISTSKQPEKKAYDALLNYTTNQRNNPFVKLKIMSEAMPKPINRWILQITNNAWSAINTEAGKYLNSKWDQLHYPYHLHKLMQQYPLTPSSQSQLSMDDFKATFGKSGFIHQYFKQYIKPFFTIKKDRWSLKNNHGFTIALPNSVITMFHQATIIEQHYFNSDDDPAISMVITPTALDYNLKSISINLSNLSIDYKHGPREAYSLKWPYKSINPSTSLIITDFNNQHYSKNFSGPWSLFKLFQSPYITLQPSNNNIITNINIEGFQGQFTIQTAMPLSGLLLQNFTNLDLPKTIIKEQQP